MAPISHFGILERCVNCHLVIAGKSLGQHFMWGKWGQILIWKGIEPIFSSWIEKKYSRYLCIFLWWSICCGQEGGGGQGGQTTTMQRQMSLQGGGMTLPGQGGQDAVRNTTTTTMQELIQSWWAIYLISVKNGYDGDFVYGLTSFQIFIRCCDQIFSLEPDTICHILSKQFNYTILHQTYMSESL